MLVGYEKIPEVLKDSFVKKLRSKTVSAINPMDKYFSKQKYYIIKEDIALNEYWKLHLKTINKDNFGGKMQNIQQEFSNFIPKVLDKRIDEADLKFVMAFMAKNYPKYYNFFSNLRLNIYLIPYSSREDNSSVFVDPQGEYCMLWTYFVEQSSQNLEINIYNVLAFLLGVCLGSYLTKSYGDIPKDFVNEVLNEDIVKTHNLVSIFGFAFAEYLFHGTSLQDYEPFKLILAKDYQVLKKYFDNLEVDGDF